MVHATSPVPAKAPQHTHFAPAEREDRQTICRQTALVGDAPLIKALLDIGTGCVLILNSRRQIIAAGKRLEALVPDKTLDQLLGLRPGEAVGCTHSTDCPGGCGTSEHCRECGAAKAILAAVDGSELSQECHLMLRKADGKFTAMDLQVQATPFEVAGEHLVILAISDISHEKRRRALERVFFHDVINLAGGIQGLLEAMEYTAPHHMKEMIDMSLVNVRDLVEEILIQRDLVAAERDELVTHPALLASTVVLRQLAAVYQAHKVSAGKHIRVRPESECFELTTDPTLLKRILGNLVKNAAEASAAGDQITLSCKRVEGDMARFEVHNPGFIPAPVQRQMFMRSFSTKGEGRGLGTYSVKLLGEKYLNGHIGFSSTEAEGTRFHLTIPLVL